MRSLWQGRHDAALVALHSQPDFWKHLTNPLFNELQLEEVEEADSEVSCSCMDLYHRNSISNLVLKLSLKESGARL